MVIASKHNQNDAVFATSKTALSNYFGTAKISIHICKYHTLWMENFSLMHVWSFSQYNKLGFVGSRKFLTGDA